MVGCFWNCIQGIGCRQVFLSFVFVLFVCFFFTFFCKSGEFVAIKRISTARMRAKEIERLKAEGMLMKRLEHENIVGFRDVLERNGYIYFILEYEKEMFVSFFWFHRTQHLSGLSTLGLSHR